MIELGRYARDGQLRGFLQQPWLQAFNGIEGIALGYDERLVAEAERALTGFLPGHWQGTIEHSHHVAALLAAVSARWEGPGDRYIEEDSLIGHLGERLADWWDWFSQRRGGPKRSPIVVEVAAGSGFGRDARPPRELSRDYPYRYSIRRTRGARLQAAATGGRIAEGKLSARYGTTGGFLVDDFTGDIFSLTAAHVCGDRIGKARAVPMPKAGPFARRHADTILGALGMGRFRSELCAPLWSSWPQPVPFAQCKVSAVPDTDGVDAALHTVSPKTNLTPVEIADLADISQALELTFCGATSGLQRAAPTSLSIWHSYELDGENVCIHDCVQIRLAARPYVRTDLSRGGDSGSWLMARGIKQPHWVGLLTGGDGERAGIAPSRRIAAKIEEELGLLVSAWV